MSVNVCRLQLQLNTAKNDHRHHVKDESGHHKDEVRVHKAVITVEKHALNAVNTVRRSYSFCGSSLSPCDATAATAAIATVTMNQSERGKWAATPAFILLF